jgi:hypothetical protein
MALLGSSGRAEAQSEATTNTPAPLNIWYRSSEGCPEGAVFVARLAELGRRATLARVGDRVDFVVTVASASLASSGRLERQTSRGTVAIRELEAPRCDEVAEALALSLELALTPASEATAGTITGVSAVNDEAANSASSQPAQPIAPSDRMPHVAAVVDRERGVLQLGAQGSLAQGITPSWAPGGAVFAELRSRNERAIAGRVSLGAAVASHTAAGIDARVLWLAGRVEGCVFELRSGRLSLQPCAGAELGMMRAHSSGGAARTDAGLWGAGVVLGRVSVELDEHFALEAQVGAAFPLVRYAVGSSLGGDLFRTEPITGALALGARWAP